MGKETAYSYFKL